jgi:hypothetical protein
MSRNGFAVLVTPACLGGWLKNFRLAQATHARDGVGAGGLCLGFAAFASDAPADGATARKIRLDLAAEME